MYYQDLTPYEYFVGRKTSAINIGWLDSSRVFTRGPVPDGFVARLRALEQHRVRQTRGFHVCPFCDPGDCKAVSSAEIEVAGGEGKVYAAPMLIGHYVEVHGYRPPDEFVEAVMGMKNE